MRKTPRKLVFVFNLVTLSGLAFLLWRISSLEIWTSHTTNAVHQPQNPIQSVLKESERLNYSYCAHLGQEPTAEEAREEHLLLKSITWPDPPVLGLPLRQSSHAAQSYYTIQSSGEARVGGQLVVNVHMRNFWGQPKRHGGDFLIARLHMPELEAGVAGLVRDHGNGSYTVFFTLLWTGVSRVEVTMVHPSEAVVVLKRLRVEESDRVFFKSLFRSGSISETTVCNLCLPSNQTPLCDYTDVLTGEPWFCFKPKHLECDTRINHATGGSKKNVITAYESQFFQRDVNMKVPVAAAGANSVTVLPAFKVETTRTHLEFSPAGFYSHGLWRPLGGVAMRQFNSPSAISSCLKGKMVHMFGDSTVRQWYEYIVAHVPELKDFDVHRLKKVGPLQAVDNTHNILLRYRCHGPPIRFSPVYSAEMHYISNELNGLQGGSDTVVLISIWSHFKTYPVPAYIRRLRHIRKAVLQLLKREPATLVLIRTPNLQELGPENCLIDSDWFSKQLDVVLQEMFRGLKVHLVDAWEMTLAHQNRHELHPRPNIIANMVNLVLSHICPDKSG